ncbi:MAG: glucose-6-phosphate dehydrogenase assembly protein OpcA [Chloroflexota bacterium]|nr:glucose-6-phosphate dehydrogenase assembly protein OpcA [Chloroflexota bacterium]
MAPDLNLGPAQPGEPTLRWMSRASTIDGIERELAKIWAMPAMATHLEDDERHIAARTSVMNLVVVARRPEIGEHCASIISLLTGRHPSRTLICSPTDPDGPGWLDARISAYCMLAREGATETCAETIYITAGGDTGRHIAAIVEPLLIHDLPVTVWWPGETPLASRQATDLLEDAQRLVIDGSAWTGDGLDHLREVARLVDGGQVSVFDFALVRQSRWREAIASAFDHPAFLPYLRSLRRIEVTFGSHDGLGRTGTTNIVKPLYHAAWLGSRLGMSVVRPLAPIGPSADGPGYGGTLRYGRIEVAVVLRPTPTDMASGTTLRVELLARRRGSELRVDVTAEAETVAVRAWQDGAELLDRRFLAPRRTEADLLAEAIEAPSRDIVADGAIRMAGRMVTPRETGA